MGDGGKWVCGLEYIQNKKKCVIYSFGKAHSSVGVDLALDCVLIRLLARTLGINGESSFEAELLEKAPGCEVWGYDFSVTSVGFHLNSKSSIRQHAHLSGSSTVGS